MLRLVLMVVQMYYVQDLARMRALMHICSAKDLTRTRKRALMRMCSACPCTHPLASARARVSPQHPGAQIMHSRAGSGSRCKLAKQSHYLVKIAGLQGLFALFNQLGALRVWLFLVVSACVHACVCVPKLSLETHALSEKSLYSEGDHPSLLMLCAQSRPHPASVTTRYHHHTRFPRFEAHGPAHGPEHEQQSNSQRNKPAHTNPTARTFGHRSWRSLLSSWLHHRLALRPPCSHAWARRSLTRLQSRLQSHAYVWF